MGEPTGQADEEKNELHNIVGDWNLDEPGGGFRSGEGKKTIIMGFLYAAVLVAGLVISSMLAWPPYL